MKPAMPSRYGDPTIRRNPARAEPPMISRSRCACVWSRVAARTPRARIARRPISSISADSSSSGRMPKRSATSEVMPDPTSPPSVPPAETTANRRRPCSGVNTSLITAQNSDTANTV